jgi:hypothetical protein
MIQLVQFHRSANVPALENPTATHLEADVHATPVRKPPPAAGSGVGWTVQPVPFHRSAKVPALELPTATHADAEVHATPVRKPPPAAGSGVGWIVQVTPFQRSANRTDRPARLTPWPTAVHAEDEEQDTLTSSLTLIPGGLGVGWTVHLVPSERSARVATTPESRVKSPTAVQEDELEQETPTRLPVPANIFAVGAIDQPDPVVAADGGDDSRGVVPRTGPLGGILAPGRSR